MDPRGVPYGDDDRTVPAWAGGLPPPPPPQRNWLWVVVAATVVIVIASVVTIIVSTTGGDDSTTAATTSSTKASTTKAGVPKTTTPAPLPPPPSPTTPLAPEALSGLLITGQEAAAGFQIPNTKESTVKTDLIGGTSAIPEGCLPVWAPVHKETLEPTGLTAVARKNIRDDPGTAGWLVEGVVSYPDAAAARAAVDRVVEVWRKCQYVGFTEQYLDRSLEWKTGVVGDTDGVFTMFDFSRSQLDSPQTSTDPNCQRAITSARNVVVDLLACKVGLGSEGYSFARDIVRKIDATP